MVGFNSSISGSIIKVKITTDVYAILVVLITIANSWAICSFETIILLLFIQFVSEYFSQRIAQLLRGRFRPELDIFLFYVRAERKSSRERLSLRT